MDPEQGLWTNDPVIHIAGEGSDNIQNQSRGEKSFRAIVGINRETVVIKFRGLIVLLAILNLTLSYEKWYF